MTKYIKMLAFAALAVLAIVIDMQVWERDLATACGAIGLGGAIVAVLTEVVVFFCSKEHIGTIPQNAIKNIAGILVGIVLVLLYHWIV